MRDTAITIATDLGYQVIERPIPRTELYLADEIFLTGTAAEIVPVISIDGHAVGSNNSNNNNGKEGPITKSIRQAYEKIVVSAAEIKDYYKDWLIPIWQY